MKHKLIFIVFFSLFQIYGMHAQDVHSPKIDKKIRKMDKKEQERQDILKNRPANKYNIMKSAKKKRKEHKKDNKADRKENKIDKQQNKM